MDTYEQITIAIGMIDSAVAALEEAADYDDAVSQLHALRNDLNADRVLMRGNGSRPPFYTLEALAVRR